MSSKKDLKIEMLCAKEIPDLEFPSQSLTIYPSNKEIVDKINEIIDKFNYLVEVLSNDK